MGHAPCYFRNTSTWINESVAQETETRIKFVDADPMFDAHATLTQ